MTKAIDKRRTSTLCLMLTPHEMDRLKKEHARSICRTLSDYARTMLFKSKITILYRNQSFDDFMDESIRLRKEMGACKDRLDPSSDNSGRTLALMEEIKETMTKIYNLCMPQ